MIKIIDNFLDKETHNKIYNLLIDKNFNWHIAKEMVNGDENKNWFFYHTGIEDQKICTPDGTYNSVFHPVLSKVESSLHLPVECIKNNDRFPRAWRAKINCYPKNKDFKFSDLHTDHIKYHIVAIYYVNSNDGFTELQDKGKIESKANRLVLFSGDILHRAIGHTDTNVRLNMNINYMKHEE